MKTTCRYGLLFSGLVLSVFLLSLDSFSQTQGLLYESDLTYVGSFKTPGGNFGMTDGTCDYSNGQVAGNIYNDPVNGKSIFLTGYLSAGYVSSTPSIVQIAIPELKDANTTGIDGLNTGTVVQGFADPSNGKGGQALGSAGSWALVCYGNKLIGTGNVAYDASCSQTKSAWVSSLSFSQASQATGPYAFNSPVGPRLIGGGYMTLIPAEWQAALGGKVVSGNGPWSIIGCGSPGPTLHVLDADMLVTQPAASTVIPSTPLVYYQTGDHSSLGVWNSNDPDQVIDGKQIPNITVVDPHGRGTFTIAYEDNSMRVTGVLFAEGTRSVLFFGHKGLGDYCYGCGGATNPGGECANQWCYDPDGDGKGDHCYPYTEFVWAYDVNDLIAAKNGEKEPWEVLPYTGWIPILPQDGTSGRGIGVVWDSDTRTAYLVQAGVVPGWSRPAIHAFYVADKSVPVEEGNTGTTRISIITTPNPFNPAVLISVGSQGIVPLQIMVFNISGRCIADLTSNINNNQVVWNAVNQPSGVYVVRVKTGQTMACKRLSLMK